MALSFVLTHFVAALAAVVAATAFAHVGRRFWAQEVGAEALHATRLFGLWWVMLAVYALLGGFLLNILASAGWLDVAVFHTIRSVSIVVMMLGLFGLSYHALFLVTGSSRLLLPLGAFYLVAYATIVHAFAGAKPVAIELLAWETRMVYDPALSPAQMLLVLALLLLPQVTAGLLYVWVGLRLRDVDQRRRALLVGIAITAWASSNLLAYLWANEGFQFLAKPIMGIAAALIVLAAYSAPPSPVRGGRRMHDRGMGERLRLLI